MKITNIYKKTAALFFLMAAALWPAVDAWGQETGDMYNSWYEDYTIKHKPAKWHNLREQSGNRFVDDFSNDEEFFTYYNGTQILKYQAAHTIVDTLYVRKGSSVDLALPDRREGFETDNAATNIGSYQRWFNFRTGGVFNTSTTGIDDWRVVDLLTPTTYRDTYYRFQNGYVNRPIVDWNSALPARMTFYYPTDYQFDNGNYKPDGQTDNSYYLVACDLSGYMDFSEDGSTATFGTGGTYYEPTLTHRVIYYIVGVDGNWDRPLEEYEIDFPAYTLPNKSNEMVALSMDARSYLAGTGAISLTATISDNTAGIGLVSGNNKDLSTTNTANSVTLTGDDRSIFFRMPNQNITDGSRYINNIDNNPTATINVRAGNTLVAKFKLNFKNESRLLTQSIVNALNNGSVTQGATWENLDYRTPESLTNEHILLTKLDFDYESSYAKRDLFYPYPLSWESNTYGFYDGSNDTDFTGGGETYYYFPEYGSYSLLRSDKGYVESDYTWGWRNNVIGDFPPIIQNSEGNNSTYHLFVDASDRPGLIARLPFEENLCAGSVLYVSAWVKTARWDNDSDNAAVLFTIMGVTKDEDGKETFTPIHRYQTGQIPATYKGMNDYGLNIDGLGNNEWMQAYFSFTNSSELSFDHYVLQVDNNSPSTQGGDIYLDDVRVYISKPLAEARQLRSACTTERTLMSLRLDWDRFMARVGNEGVAETRNLGICFIDTLLFHNNFDPTQYDPDLTHFKDAMEKSAVHLGQEGQSYEFRVLKYNSDFELNNVYDLNNVGGNLAINNNDAFYGYTSNDSTALAVDFFGDLIPGRTYWILLVPDPDGIITTEDGLHMLNPIAFEGFYNNPCAIKAEFHVTGNTTIKIDGEIVTPETEYCRGNINNFTVDLQVPHGNGSGDMVTVPENSVFFDWFFGESREGEIADPQAQYVEENNKFGDVTLQDALTIFRNLAPSATGLDSDLINKADENNNVFTKNMYDLINYYLNEAPVPEGAQNRPLVLHRPSLNITLLDVMRVVVCPIPLSISDEALKEIGYDSLDEWEAANICWGYTYLELTTTNAAPTVYPGFNTVAYPTDLTGQSLRIGLDQISSVARGNVNNTLTVDLRDAKSSKTIDPDSPDTGFTLQLIGGKDNPDLDYNKLFLTDTDDPDMKAFIDEQGTSFDNHSLPIGEVKSFEAHYYTEGTTTRKNEMQLQFILDEQDVLINGENKKFTFKPREGYYYTFNVYFEEAAISGSATACYGRFPLTMKVVPEYLVWNDTQKKDDYSTIGNWNYDGNWLRATNADIKATNTIDEYYNDNRAFVPMLFSKVLIPANSKIWLYQAGYGENGSWVNSDRPAEVADPTQNIQYDLMAFDHPENDPDFPGQLKTERYRVSLLDEIHFEPGAEMLHSEYLIHNKAYVDYKVSPGKWYSWATPIDGVVAGDFYTDNDGIEKQEYFTDINFDSNSNNRFKPSVYQRMWKGESTEIPLYTDAKTKKNVAISGNWSALTNDVAEKYEPGKGFSLKVQDVTTDEAIFRLPKADTKYDLYHYNNGQPSAGGEITITRSYGSDTKGNLVARQLYNRNTDIEQATKGAPITVNLSESATKDYYLVGNPFMAHLDMSAFIKENEGVIEPKYWAVADGVQNIAVVNPNDDSWITVNENSTATVAPLQSFFVQKKTGVSNNDITFTQDMQTLGGTGDGLRSANALTITATTTDGRTSRAAVAYDMAASADYEVSEDAELFLDSNLGDVPMVYTVAGTMATSINRTSELYNIPLGVYGSKQEMVTLSFGGLNQFSSATLYDAQEQTETPLREGKTVSVPAGTSGRYFLRAGTPTGNEVIARNAFLVYSVGGGKVMVTSSNTPLKDIRVYTMGGAQVRSIQASGMQQEIYLNRGIYLITVSDQDGLQETKKVLVR